jgi:DNA transposition AAA+ family ATPase
MGQIIMTVELKEALSEGEIENVRAQVRDLMAREGLTQTAIAKEADIPFGTFTPWMGGKYQGDNGKLAQKVQRWMEARKEAQKISVRIPKEPGFVLTPTTNDVLQLLQWAKEAPGITLITLGPGMGKTTTARHFALTTPHAYRVVMRPSTSGVHSMMKEIAQTLGVTERDPGKLTRAIGDKLRRNGRHTLIMVDEAQNLRDEAVDELRHYLDEYGCGIALLGNEDVQTRWGRSTPKEGYGQLHRRIGPRLRLLKPRVEDVEAYLAAWNIQDPGILKLLRVIGRKAGALGQISETVKMASILAAGHGRDLSADDIKSAWNNRGGEDV